jgi:nucleoside-diphosphate-sugar epimerase
MADTVLVTGAAGFIGSHVVAALLSRGQRAVGVDNFDPYYPRAAKERNLAELRAHPRHADFAFAEADITDPAAMARLFAQHKPTGVIHLAAKAGVRPSLDNPVAYAHANVTGTAVILEAAHKAGCARLVAASSSSVYGNCPKAPFSEEFDVSEPISPYAATKRACELIAYTHHHVSNMPTGMLRFFTVYGPRQRPDLAISLFLRKAARGEEIEAFGDPRSSRDYTFIDDIVAGVLASYDRVHERGYRVWNLGNNSPVALADLIDAVGKTVGKPVRVKALPARVGDVQRTWADLTRSSAEIGYAPKTSLLAGLARQFEWLKATGQI